MVIKSADSCERCVFGSEKLEACENIQNKTPCPHFIDREYYIEYGEKQDENLQELPKRGYNYLPDCSYHAGVLCGDKKCALCGWNPANSELRDLRVWKQMQKVRNGKK